MDGHPEHTEMTEATIEEVAAWLSAAEGRQVSIHEVRLIEAQALRKLRHKLLERGLSPDNLLPDK